MDQTHVDHLARARRRHLEVTRIDELAAARARLAELQERAELAQAGDVDELPDVYEDNAPRAFLSL